MLLAWPRRPGRAYEGIVGTIGHWLCPDPVPYFVCKHECEGLLAKAQRSG